MNGSTEQAPRIASPSDRRRRRVAGLVTKAAMASWFVLAAMPVAVVIAALT